MSSKRLIDGVSEDMYIVWDNDDGLVCIGTRDNAIEEYESQVERVKDYVQGEGEFSVDLSERVVLARIERQLYPIPSKELNGAYGWEEKVSPSNQGEAARLREALNKIMDEVEKHTSE